MRELVQRTFEHAGRRFVAKLYEDDSRFSVVVFLDGDQVSPSYSVDFVTHQDYFMQHKEKLIEHLFELAQSDIKQEMYFHAS
jgi:hypothetical protein